MTAERIARVPVDAGELAVGVWGPAGGPVVVAVHGITSSHRFFDLIAPLLAAEGLAVWAPDLRGRGASADVPGASIAQHADDLLAVAAHAGCVGPTLLVGHSMGGFVVSTAAARHPDAVAGVVLVDGGPPLVDELSADTDVEPVLHAVIGPALDRLAQEFASPEDYIDFWRAHPAMAAVPAAVLEDYARYDLRQAGATWRSRVDRGSVIEDARGTLLSADVRQACEHVAVPARLVVAERGMLDGPEPLYGVERVRAAVARNPDLAVRRVADTNHYTIGLSPHGARAVAQEVLALHAHLQREQESHP